MNEDVRQLASDHLILEEGFRPSAYLDHLGYLTIGIGRMIDEKKGGGISRDEALHLLSNDLDKIDAQLSAKLPWWTTLSTTRQAILISMAFQMGISGLMKFKRTLDYIESGNYVMAARHMQLSLWARQTPGRARRMASAMETNDPTQLRAILNF